MDLDALTVLALYFSPDLDEARSRIAASEAAIITARAGSSTVTRKFDSPAAFLVWPTVGPAAR